MRLHGRTALLLGMLWLLLLPAVWLSLLLLVTSWILIGALWRRWPVALLLLCACLTVGCTSPPPSVLDCHLNLRLVVPTLLTEPETASLTLADDFYEAAMSCRF